MPKYLPFMLMPARLLCSSDLAASWTLNLWFWLDVRKVGGDGGDGGASKPPGSPKKSGSIKKTSAVDLAALKSEWFFPGAKKEPCEKQILAGQDGDFLVRANKDKDKFFVMVKDQDQVAAFAVTVDGADWSFAGKKHKSIEEIITNLSKVEVKGKSGRGIKLKGPAPGGEPKKK